MNSACPGQNFSEISMSGTELSMKPACPGQQNLSERRNKQTKMFVGIFTKHQTLTYKISLGTLYAFVNCVRTKREERR